MDDIEAVKQLLLKLAVIADRLDARSEQAVQGVEAGTATLAQSAHQLQSGAGQFARQALQAIGEQAQQAIAHSADSAIATFEGRLQHAADNANRAADAMADQRARLAKSQKSLVAAAVTTLLAGSVLAVGGTWLWVDGSRDEVARHHVEVRLLSAINASDIVLCADGRLCVNVDDRGKRQGDRRQYQVVEPRQTQR